MELEIKVMGCKSLASFNFFQKLTVYASVSIISEDERIQLTHDQKQEQKTPVDEQGDGNPEWNYPMKFNLGSLNSINPSLNLLSLLFELRHSGQFFGDKSIGEVRVLLKDLVDSVGSEFLRFVSYEVRNSEGKHNGVLDFSYKLICINNANIGSSNHENYISGYHQHHHHHQDHHDQQSDQSYEHYASSDGHVIGYHHHHSGSNLDESTSIYESEIIQYPKIDFEEYNAPLVYPPPSSSSSSLFSFSSSSISVHYHSSASDLYPPPQTWTPSPPPPPQSHCPPPPSPLQHYVYLPPPPPTQSQPQQHRDPHWGYQRPPEHHHW